MRPDSTVAGSRDKSSPGRRREQQVMNRGGGEKKSKGGEGLVENCQDKGPGRSGSLWSGNEDNVPWRQNEDGAGSRHKSGPPRLGFPLRGYEGTTQGTTNDGLDGVRNLTVMNKEDLTRKLTLEGQPGGLEEREGGRLRK